MNITTKNTPITQNDRLIFVISNIKANFLFKKSAKDQYYKDKSAQ